MTRVLVYTAALVAFVAATAMTLAAITLPTWISYSASPSLISNYGLHRICQSIDLSLLASNTSPYSTNVFDFSPNPSNFATSTAHKPHCRDFPIQQDCRGDERYFCSLWRTAGFLLSFTAALELAIIVCFIVVLGGGKQKREHGWKFVAGLMLAVAMFQAAGGSIVAYLFDHDEKFNVPGFGLGEAWILSTISWTVSVIASAFLVLSAYLFPKEAGYELIPSERQYD